MRRGIVLAGLAVMALAAAAPSSPGAGTCTRTAKALAKKLPNARYAFVGQAVCFDFTGDGRRDVVLTQWVAMNHGAHYWAAYRKRSGAGYSRVMYSGDCCVRTRDEGTGVSIRRAGPDISVKQPVYKGRDPLCCPSGGTKTGRWHWHRGALHLAAVTRHR